MASAASDYREAGRGELRGQRLATQERQIMSMLGELRGDAGAQRTHGLDAVACRRLRIARLEPVEQGVFRRGDYRGHRPQSVVQIEADDSRCGAEDAFVLATMLDGPTERPDAGTARGAGWRAPADHQLLVDVWFVSGVAPKS